MKYIIYKYFVSVCSLSYLHSLDGVFLKSRSKKKLIKSVLLWFVHFWLVSQLKSLPKQGHKCVLIEVL